MENTFKTFPSKDGVSPIEWCILAEEWKERIEKELREKLVATTLEHVFPHPEFWKGWNKMIKEILEE